ncbi:MAG: RNA polymerase sigma factor RpoD/SigA [Candidatus Nealsonbacteria bacterium]|nr:RNA polymerase sigma factor RpoD/SigA [Candidatus Nealsonbacteria bacterium]
MLNDLLQKVSSGFWNSDYLPYALSPREEKELFQELEKNPENKEVWGKIIEKNTRLVRFWALKIKKSHSIFGLEFNDLCQIGSIGLMKAVNRFKLRKGYKFSTYALWWINQAIMRTLENESRIIRIPASKVRMVVRYKKAEAKLYQELRRPPSLQEIAEELKIEITKVNLLKEIKNDAISLDSPLSGDEEKDTLIYFIEDEKADSPLLRAEEENLKEKLKEILSSCLSPRENKILVMRFGLEDGICHTLQEAGKVFSITRERTRQIQKKALTKLNQNQQLRELLE